MKYEKRTIFSKRLKLRNYRRIIMNSQNIYDIMKNSVITDNMREGTGYDK